MQYSDRHVILCSSIRLWYFPRSLSRVQTSCVLKASSLLCVLHRSVSPADVVIFFRLYISGLKRCTALSDVSTLSFPLQSRRIRSRSCEDRSLEWTQSSCRADRSFWFNINPPHAAATDFDVMFMLLDESREREKTASMCICFRAVGTKWHKNKVFNFVVLHFRARIASLTFKHGI